MVGAQFSRTPAARTAQRTHVLKEGMTDCSLAVPHSGAVVLVELHYLDTLSCFPKTTEGSQGLKTVLHGQLFLCVCSFTFSMSYLLP